jgi:hypothetical protein
MFAHLLSRLPTDISALESSISALENSISALESEIKSLESSTSPWELGIIVATGAVVVGLVMEYWVIWREHRDEWNDFELGIWQLAHKPSLRKYVIELISVSLITIGVFVEFAAGLKVASINSTLRAKSEELRSLNGILRSKSELLLAVATQLAGSAETSVKTAQGIVNGLVAEVAELSPRNLNPKEQSDIIAALKPSFWGHPSVMVGSYAMDGEGTVLATQLLNVLALSTGVTPTDARAQISVTGGFEWGVNIRGPDSEKPFMDELSRVLTDIGHLKRVHINGLTPPIGFIRGGNSVMGGNAIAGGGGGPMRPPVIPPSGPVSVWVGIRPPVLLPQAKEQTNTKTSK